MITDDDVMRLFEQADPARTRGENNNTTDATGYLDALRTRSNNVTYIDPTEKSTEQPDRRRWYMIGGAAAAVAVLVVGGLVLLSRDSADEPEVPATVPPTTSEAVQIDNAVGRATTFLASIEARDFAAVEEQLADDFTARGAFPNEDFGEPSTIDDLFGLRYEVAVGTRYVNPECSVASQDSTTTVVECQAEMELVVHQFTNADGVPTTVAITLTDDGVTEMTAKFQRNYGSDLRPFDEWVGENRPRLLSDDQDPQSPAELEPYAELERTLAADWVAFGIDAVERVLVGYDDVIREGFPEATQPDLFFALFASGVDVLGVDAAEARDAVEALLTSGVRYEPSNCQPSGVAPGGLSVRCDVAIQVPSLESTGIVLGGTFTMAVGPDGTITSSSDTVNWDVLHDVNDAFKQWLAGEHATVHDDVEWVAFGRSSLLSGRADDQSVVAQYLDDFVAQSTVYPLGG